MLSSPNLNMMEDISHGSACRSETSWPSFNEVRFVGSGLRTFTRTFLSRPARVAVAGLTSTLALADSVSLQNITGIGRCLRTLACGTKRPPPNVRVRRTLYKVWGQRRSFLLCELRRHNNCKKGRVTVSAAWQRQKGTTIMSQDRSWPLRCGFSQAK